jgi:hypothetical protein
MILAGQMPQIPAKTIFIYSPWLCESLLINFPQKRSTREEVILNEKQNDS